MSKIKSYWHQLKPKLKSKKAIIALVGLAVIILLLTRNGDEGAKNTFEVKRSAFVKSVSVSGKAVAVGDVDLGFETSGKVVRVYKQVGDKVYAGEVIVALNSSELQASRDKARADVLAEQAELQKLKSSENDTTEVLNNRKLLVNSIFDAYTQADDAIRNKVDQFYENPRSSNPKIKYTFNRYDATRDKLNDSREEIEKLLTTWQMDMGSLSAENYKQSDQDKTISNLAVIKKFLDDVSLAVNSFVERDDLTAAMIDKYKTDVATARSNINEAVSSLTSISDDLRSSVSQIPVQEAKVKAAEAEVRNFDAQIAQTLITAPFSGVVSLQDAKVGESLSANTTVVSIITDNLEIEAFVPEVSISNISLDNRAEIILDAHPEVALVGKVTHVDPGETEKDGVSNYKVKLSFQDSENLAKPGMTVDVRIITGQEENVMAIPERAVLRENGKTNVIVIGAEENEKREVVLGERDGHGNIKVISGISEGERISLDPVALNK